MSREDLLQLEDTEREDKVNDLIGKLEIDKKNGNISLQAQLDQENLSEIALFTMFVSSEEEEESG